MGHRVSVEGIDGSNYRVTVEGKKEERKPILDGLQRVIVLRLEN